MRREHRLVLLDGAQRGQRRLDLGVGCLGESAREVLVDGIGDGVHAAFDFEAELRRVIVERAREEIRHIHWGAAAEKLVPVYESVLRR